MRLSCQVWQKAKQNIIDIMSHAIIYIRLMGANDNRNMRIVSNCE